MADCVLTSCWQGDIQQGEPGVAADGVGDGGHPAGGGRAERRAQGLHGRAAARAVRRRRRRAPLAAHRRTSHARTG